MTAAAAAGGPPPPSTPPAPSSPPNEQRAAAAPSSSSPPSPLEQLARAHPEMRRAAALLGALADAVAEGAAAWRDAGHDQRLDPAVLAARLDGGVPALTGERLLDGAELLAAVRGVAAALERAGAGEAARAVVAALGDARALGAEGADALAEEALAGEWDGARDLARRLDLDDDALVTLLDYAVRGALRAAGARVAELRATPGAVRREWDRGRCPACGAPPVLAELRGKEQSRTLRCARCDAAWSFPRVACPACGERDHRKLVAVHGEGEESYRRADCCDSCGTYVKAVATLAPLSPDALMETDLATAALDMVAVDRGYHR